MANEEHLAILKQGVVAWNKWRTQQTAIQPDLSGADLSEADLYQANLGMVDLGMADLHNADLRHANLSRTSLHNANLSEANLGGADLTFAYLDRANLRGASLGYAAVMPAKLDEADLSEADLTGANLRGARLTKVTLRKTTLTGADLTDTDLAWAYLGGTILTGANLSQANLREATLLQATLDEASLSQTRLMLTVFADVDLSSVKDLDTIRHWGPSTIGIDTIYRSRGQLPEAFLRGCGVPDEIITFAHALAAHGQAMPFHSCFISYSDQNHDIANRLYADLQSAGVRCWFAPHDLPIGEPIVRGLDEAIQGTQKLLLVLSKEALASHWVQHEVETALYRQASEGRDILLPIRLDDEVLTRDTPWALRLRQFNIGDFTHWQDRDAYQQAFARLLHDLKVAPLP